MKMSEHDHSKMGHNMGGGSGDGMMMMPMFFQFSFSAGPMLFPGLSVQSFSGFFILALGIAGLCLLKEWLYAWRVHKLTSAASPSADSSSATADSQPLLASRARAHSGPAAAARHAQEQLQHLRMLNSAVYGLNLALGYLVMLCLMSYNAGLFLVIVLASACGHFMFQPPPQLPSALGIAAASPAAASKRLAHEAAIAIAAQTEGDCCEK